MSSFPKLKGCPINISWLILKYQILNRTVHILLAESSTTASDKEETHDSPNLKDKDVKCRWQNEVLAIRQCGLNPALARHIELAPEADAS